MTQMKDTTINGDLTVTGNTTINSKLYLDGIIDTKTNALLSIADVINNHQKQIDNLLIPTNTYSLDITGGNVKFYKIGRFVFVSCRSAFTPVSGTGSLGTIPEAFRPIETVSISVNGTYNWCINNWLSVYLYADGRFLYATYNTNSTEVYFSTAYITAS